MKIQISNRHGPFGFANSQLETDGHILRFDWPANEIEGMICHWEFTEEFVNFNGPKVFYCCEPSFYFRGFAAPKRQLRRRIGDLREDEFAWHYHPSESMRVVHHTDWGSVAQHAGKAPRKPNAIAVLGNLGRPILRNLGRQARLEFIVGSGCHIFGPKGQWARFQLRVFGPKGPPSTYQGEIPFGVGPKLDRLLEYRACICLENSAESLYFTEKFPHAVLAGCIPIYHAHPSVKQAFLQGAIWIDPADYDWDPKATMVAAENLNREEVDKANRLWLESHPKFQKTTLASVYSHLAEIVAHKANGKINLPSRARRVQLDDDY